MSCLYIPSLPLVLVKSINYKAIIKMTIQIFFMGFLFQNMVIAHFGVSNIALLYWLRSVSKKQFCQMRVDNTLLKTHMYQIPGIITTMEVVGAVSERRSTCHHLSQKPVTMASAKMSFFEIKYLSCGYKT